MTACALDGFKPAAAVQSTSATQTAAAAVPRVTPPLYAYSDDVQLKALEELNVLPGPCARLAVDTSHCSALQAMMPDYSTVRDKLRSQGAMPQ